MKKSVIEELPVSLRNFVGKHPDIWQTYAELGEKCLNAGPLKAKEIHLIKITIYAIRQLVTPLKTHVRHALKTGANQAEIEHAIIQLLTAEGISTTMMAMKWANEVIEEEKAKKKRPRAKSS